jgi:type III secretory pathway component EscT
MGLVLRGALAVGGALAAVFVARDAPQFQVVQAMMTIAAIAAGVILVAVARR